VKNIEQISLCIKWTYGLANFAFHHHPSLTPNPTPILLFRHHSAGRLLIKFYEHNTILLSLNLYHTSEHKMQFSIITLILSLGAITSASVLGERQNAGRPVPSGSCCVANTSLKQDTCTSTSGAAGRCVPGGNNCKYLALQRNLEKTHD
jgi:hypothetical protein